jgi:hypothetical protein
MGWRLGIEWVKQGKGYARIEFFSLLTLGEGPGMRAYGNNPSMNFYSARMAFNDKGNQLEFAA